MKIKEKTKPWQNFTVEYNINKKKILIVMMETLTPPQ